MASPILEVIELYDGRGASFGSEGERRQERRFHVKTVSGTTDPRLVLRAGNSAESAGGPRVPAYLEHYQSPDGSADPAMRVIDLDAKPNRAHDLWLVTAKYSSRLNREQMRQAGYGQGPQGQGGTTNSPIPGLDTGAAGGNPDGSPSTGTGQVENPLLRPPEVKFYAVRKNRVLEKEPDQADPNIQPGGVRFIRNSAGAMFDPPVEVEDVMLGISVRKNQLTFLAGMIKAYVNSVNKKSWKGLAEFTVRCVDIDAEQAFEQGIWYWKVGYKFEIVCRPDENWLLRVQDSGTYVLDANNKPDFFLDAKGRPIHKGMLDGKGKQLAFGLTPLFVSPPYHRYRAVDFKDLPL